MQVYDQIYTNIQLTAKKKELKIGIWNAGGKRLETHEGLNEGWNTLLDNKKPGMNLQGFISLHVTLWKQLLFGKAYDDFLTQPLTLLAV